MTLRVCLRKSNQSEHSVNKWLAGSAPAKKNLNYSHRTPPTKNHLNYFTITFHAIKFGTLIDNNAQANLLFPNYLFIFLNFIIAFTCLISFSYIHWRFFLRQICERIVCLWSWWFASPSSQTRVGCTQVLLGLRSCCLLLPLQGNKVHKLLIPNNMQLQTR